jgi:Zn-dependent protease/predicted transcriptional regulator
MKAQIKLGTVFGIEIGLHYSWLIIAVLISVSLSSYFAEAHPDWGSGTTILLAMLTAVLFFTAIVVHELSHALVALKNGLPVRSITLFALGGVAQIEKEPQDPKTEFWLGIIGPLTSLTIGLLCLGIARLAGWVPPEEPAAPLMAMLVWLGYVNLALAVFNMIPGFPMDGGRVLHALIWRITGNPAKATKAASLTGQFLAFGFIIIGIYMFFNGAGFGGLWIAFIGWFLLNSAKASYLQAEFTEGLRGVTVGDLMAPDCVVVDRNLNLQTIVDDFLLKTGRRCLMVSENEEPVGMITPHEITNFERRLWAFKTAGDAMRPLETLHTVNSRMPVIEALEIIARENINQLPVIDDGRLTGILSRDQILNYLVTRKELESV